MLLLGLYKKKWASKPVPSSLLLHRFAFFCNIYADGWLVRHAWVTTPQERQLKLASQICIRTGSREGLGDEACAKHRFCTLCSYGQGRPV